MDEEFFVGVVGIVVVILGIVLGITHIHNTATAEHTVQMKLCVDAGGEWLRAPNAVTYECRRPA